MKVKSYCVYVIVFLLCIISNFSYGKMRNATQGLIKEVGRYDCGIAYNVFIEGETAYVTGNLGVSIINIQNPMQPQQISLIKIKGGAFGIFVEQNIVYIAGQKSGVFIADISDPKIPEIIGEYIEKRGIYHQDIKVKEGHAFVSLRDGQLIVLDVSDKREPEKIGELTMGAGGDDLTVHQDIVYFANRFNGLGVIDVLDLSSPKEIFTVPGTQGASSLHIQKHFLFLGCSGNGVEILDISDPRLPKVIGSFNDGGESNGVFCSGNYLFVADQNDRFIEILDVSDPTQPFKLAENDNDKYIPHNIFYDGRYIYTADAKIGLVVFEYYPSKMD